MGLRVLLRLFVILMRGEELTINGLDSMRQADVCVFSV